ncbi:hypothetical protein LMG2828_01751 [Achromobacter piechaudii]|uniref:YfbU family protein n=1 Tax=Achromobacter piechaudii TaxID=72556 RepID=UPI0014673183|nr:YfbU family protein [Achromobacter piechaudii]CAB3847177.1 hypothetical protein LMG2828_01751 [Achromobacter piechaudii]
MSRIKLTDIERLILANQYEILAELKDDESYARRAEQLRDGHEWLYAQSFEWLSPNLPSDQAEHVLTILGIYSDLKASYEALEDKSGIEPHHVAFPGFDGNNEPELLSFSKALRDADRFTETIPEYGKNSHHPTTELYGRIIAKWQELGKPSYPLDKDTMMTIIDARIHPDNRK